MKKKFFGGIAVLALATVIGINVKMNSPVSKLGDLALANVEALAQESTGTGKTIKCYSGGSLVHCDNSLAVGITPCSNCNTSVCVIDVSGESSCFCSSCI